MMRPMQRDILGIGVVAFSVGDKVMVVGISPGVPRLPSESVPTALNSYMPNPWEGVNVNVPEALLEDA